jgi:hypothetical protein
MQKWYDQQHWLIQGIVRCFLYAVFFFLTDILIIDNIGWFEQDDTLKENIFEAVWMGTWFGVVFPLAQRIKLYKKLVPKQDESARN